MRNEAQERLDRNPETKAMLERAEKEINDAVLMELD